MSAAPEPEGAGLHVCVSNPDIPVTPARTRAFAVALTGEWRIVRAHRHVVGRFIYYLTEAPLARATTVSPPERSAEVPLRWNVDEGGEAELEQVFRHRGAVYRLDRWLSPLSNPTPSSVTS